MRALEALDDERVPALLELCLGPGSVPRTLDFWRWKHRGGPFGDSIGLLAEAPDGRIASLRVFQRWTFRQGGREVAAVRAVDTVTHPDFRRRGLFRALTGELLEGAAAAGVRLVFNTPNAESGRGYLSMGWRAAGRQPVLFRPQRPLGLLLALHRSARGPALRSGTPSAPREAPGEVTLGEGDSPFELVSKSILHDPGDPRLRTARTPAYLRWRYAEVPGVRYRMAAGGDDRDTALVVWRERHRGRAREAMLSELLCAGQGGVAAGARLLRGVARSIDVDYLAAVAVRGTPERRALLRAGFLPLPGAGPFLVTRSLDEGALATPGSADFRFSAGDLELM